MSFPGAVLCYLQFAIRLCENLNVFEHSYTFGYTTYRNNQASLKLMLVLSSDKESKEKKLNAHLTIIVSIFL